MLPFFLLPPQASALSTGKSLAEAEELTRTLSVYTPTHIFILFGAFVAFEDGFVCIYAFAIKKTKEVSRTIFGERIKHRQHQKRIFIPMALFSQR